jgi:hypothetical protein
VDVDLTVWYEPWIGEVVIKIDPEDEMQEISESNNEIWGYWDLEGIKVTELDEPVRMNGTIPVVEVYEDEPSEYALDLSQYIWDPDGHGLSFDLSPPSYSSQWVSSNDDSSVSFEPSPLFGENWFGELIFEGAAWGPGKDGIWETEDDTDTFYFEVVLEVVPVNDPPVLEAIIVSDTRFNVTDTGFVFNIEYGDPFMGEIIWSDVDGDVAVMGLEEPSGGLVLYNYTLILKSYEPEDVINTYLNITDGNGSELQRIPISIYIGEGPNPALLGISFDGETVDIPLEGGKIQVEIDERVEIDFYFIFQDAPEAYVIETNPTQSIFRWSNDSWTLIGVEVAKEFEIFEVQMGWFLDHDTDGYEGFIIELIVHNVNRAPTGLMVEVNTEYDIDTDVVLNITEAIDPDGDDLNYTINWGDGNGWEEWTPGGSTSHRYSDPGSYRIGVDVTDEWGCQQNFGSTVLITKDAGPDDDDDEEQDRGEKNDSLIAALIGVLIVIIVFILVVLVLIITRSREKEGEYYEEYYDEGLSPLEAAIASSMEE